MAMNEPDIPTRANPADAPAAIAAAVCLAVFGIAFFNGSPVIVGAWAQSGFSDQHSGWLASADNAGMVVASIVVSILVRKANRRTLVLVGIVLGILANVLAAQMSSFEALLPFRFAAGLGGGTLYALGLASLAASTHTARNFSILLFVQVSAGIIEINGIPWLYETKGLASIYLAMACGFACGGLLLPWLPARLSFYIALSSDKDSALSQIWCWGCLLAVFFFYIAIGNFWTYIERAGSAEGLSQTFITQTLTWTQLLSLAACILAAWLSERVGQLRPLIISLAIAAIVMFLLTGGISQATFIAVLVMFFMVWSATDIYQLGTLGRLDPSGRFPAMLPAFQGVSLAVGPAIGATLLEVYGDYRGVFFVSGGCALVALCFYCFLLRQVQSLETSAGDHLDQVLA